MDVSEARELAFARVLAERQNKVLAVAAEEAPERLAELLRIAEETITYAVVDESLHGARKRSELGKFILATYGAEWGAVENGRAYVERIARSVECDCVLAEIAAAID